MGTVTFLASASPQWLLLQLKIMNVLRRSLGNESPFGWCDFVTSTEQAPLRGILRSFWASRPVNARACCYEVTCLRIGAPKTQRAWDGLQRSLGRGRKPGFVHSYRPTLPWSRRHRSDWPRADISVCAAHVRFSWTKRKYLFALEMSAYVTQSGHPGLKSFLPAQRAGQRGGLRQGR